MISTLDTGWTSAPVAIVTRISGTTCTSTTVLTGAPDTVVIYIREAPRDPGLAAMERELARCHAEVEAFTAAAAAGKLAAPPALRAEKVAQRRPGPPTPPRRPAWTASLRAWR